MIINYDVNNKGGGASAEGCLRYDQPQELTDEQQQQAKDNLGIEDPEQVQADWNETDSTDPAFIKNKPTITTVNNPTITIKQGGTTKGSFTLNQAGATTINLESGGSVETYVFSYNKDIENLTASEVQNIMNIVKAGSYKHVLIKTNTSPSSGLTQKDQYWVVGYSEYENIVSSITFGYKYLFLESQKGRLRISLDANSRLVFYYDNKYVKYDESQSLTQSEKQQARNNIGAGTSNLEDAPSDDTQYARCNGEWVEIESGGEAVQSDWNETDSDDPAFIKNKPTIPTVNDPTVTIKQGGVTKGTFTLNQSGAATISLDGGGEAVQSDWNETDSTDPAFIKNKPYIPDPQNHPFVFDEPESDISCPAETKTQLCSLTIPEDGVYQISAAAVRVMLGTSLPNANVELELVFSDESENRPVASRFLHDRAGCICYAANLYHGNTVKLFATCGEACTISGSTDKQHLTYLYALRIGERSDT